MKVYRIFLASSSELQLERIEFVAFIHDYNKELKKYNIQLEVDWWEDMHDHVNNGRKQNDYNEALKISHFLVMLFWTKVGKFTKEEFDLGKKLSFEAGYPYVYTYEKKCADDEAQESKKAFLAELHKPEEEQNQTPFTELSTVTGIFRRNFQRLLDDKNNFIITKNTKPATLLSPNGAANPNYFIGREEELKEIRKRLDNCGKLMLINAEGGIGKTTLAAKYWNESLHDYKHNAWLFCNNGIVNALKELAPKLNVDLAGMDEHRQIIELQRALSGVHDDFLLVLDNANDDEDIRDFRQTFEGFHWHVLITSRCQGVLEKEQELRITHLPPPLAKALFVKYYQEDSPDFDDLLEKVLNAIEYRTLLIEIFAKNLKKARKLSLKEFLEKLETRGLFLGEDNFIIDTNYNVALKNKAASTDEILTILYDFSKLSEKARFLLVNLALLPAETYSIDFLETLFTDRSKKESNALTSNLADLFHRGWITGIEDENYRLSQVVQDLFLKKNKSQLNHNSKRLKINIVKILHDLISEKITNKDFEKKISGINNFLIRKLKTDNLLAELCCYTGIFLREKLNLDDSRKMLLFSLNFLESKKENKKIQHTLSIIYRNLAEIYFDLSDDQLGIKFLRLRIELGEKLFESDPNEKEFIWGLSVGYSSVSNYFLKKGFIDEAHNSCEKALEFSEKLIEIDKYKDEYKHRNAVCYGDLGYIFQKKGLIFCEKKYFEKALECFLIHHDAHKELAIKYPKYYKDLKASYDYLSNIYLLLAKKEVALQYFTESVHFAQKIYDQNQDLPSKRGLAIALDHLGKYYFLEDDLDNVMLFKTQSKNLFFEINEETNFSILEHIYSFAIISQNIISILHRVSKNEESIENDNLKNKIVDIAKEAILLLLPFETIGLLDPSQTPTFTDLFVGIADNYEVQLQIFQDFQINDTQKIHNEGELANWYVKLGKIYEELNYYENSLFNYQESNRITIEIASRNPNNLDVKEILANSYMNLGRFYEKNGDWANALINYKVTNEIYGVLYKNCPENISYKNGLAISHGIVGTAYDQNDDTLNAFPNYIKGNCISKEIYESDTKNHSYKVDLAYSFTRLGTFYLHQNDLGNSLNNFLESRQLFAELWQATQGPIIDITYFFALNTQYICDIVKHFIHNNQYTTEHIPSIIESIKTMRQEGHKALIYLVDEGLLQEDQMKTFVELSNETWYDF